MRSTWARSLLTLGIALSVLVPVLAVRYAVLFPTVGRGFVANAVTLVPLESVTGWLGTHVSYRWIDGVWWLFPPLGLALLVQSAWRIAALPYRNWPPRAEEMPRVRFVEGVRLSGRNVYVLAPGLP